MIKTQGKDIQTTFFLRTEFELCMNDFRLYLEPSWNMSLIYLGMTFESPLIVLEATFCSPVFNLRPTSDWPWNELRLTLKITLHLPPIDLRSTSKLPSKWSWNYLRLTPKWLSSTFIFIFYVFTLHGTISLLIAIITVRRFVIRFLCILMHNVPL